MTESEVIKCLFDWPDPDKEARKLVDEIRELSREMVHKGESGPLSVEEKGIIVTCVSGTGGIKDLNVRYKTIADKD